MLKKFLVGLGLLCSISYFGAFEASATCNEYHPQPPDTGIYWFKNNEKKKKASENPDNNYFDRTKPTMIFIHGKQNPSKVANGFYERFDYKNHDCKHGFSDDLVKVWKDKGWNVGAFYWREFATLDHRSAERSIWNSDAISGDKSVSDMFVDAYSQAMSGYGNKEIRIVGHSFGSQLALASSQKIVNSTSLPSNQKPKRVALIDPAFTISYVRHAFTSGTLGDVAASDLKNRNVAVEYYRVSLSNLGSQFGFPGGVNWDPTAIYRIRQKSAFVEIRPEYIFVDPGAKHVAAPYLYLQSMANSAPREVKVGGWEGAWQGFWIWRRWNPYAWWNPFKRVETGNDALSARTSTDQVRTMMKSGYYWNQVDGKNTARTHDDRFEKKRHW